MKKNKFQLGGFFSKLKKIINSNINSDDIPYYGGKLDDVNVVADWGKLADVLWHSAQMFPNPKFRQLFYLSVLDSPLSRDIPNFDLYSYINKIYDIWDTSGRPTIRSTEHPYNYIHGLIKGKNRANYNDIFNNIYIDPNNIDETLKSELSHAYIVRNENSPYGVFDIIGLDGDIKIDGKTGYERLGNPEHTAHSIVLPALLDYYLSKDMPIEEINNLIKIYKERSNAPIESFRKSYEKIKKEQLGGTISRIGKIVGNPNKYIQGVKAKLNLTRLKNPDWKELDYGYNYLIDRGVDHNTAVAILANVVLESGGYKNMKLLPKGRGRGLILWNDKAPDDQWGAIYDSVYSEANKYNPTTEITENYWKKLGSRSGPLILLSLRLPGGDIRKKTIDYATSYLRPGKLEPLKRLKYADYLNNIYWK